MANKTEKSARENFSVALGLTDYVNPIMYFITCVTIILNIGIIMPDMPWRIVYIAGAVLSIIFGFTIPTVKVLVGLGKFEFSLPVNLVTFVNIGIYISGNALLWNIMHPSVPVFLCINVVAIGFLTFMYLKIGKFNPVAIMIGAVGYLYIYIPMIYLSLCSGAWPSLGCYVFAIVMYLSLIVLGLKADLMDARVHWRLEFSNICCQAAVAMGTVLLFYGPAPIVMMM